MNANRQAEILGYKSPTNPSMTSCDGELEDCICVGDRVRVTNAAMEAIGWVRAVMGPKLLVEYDGMQKWHTRSNVVYEPTRRRIAIRRDAIRSQWSDDELARRSPFHRSGFEFVSYSDDFMQNYCA